MNLLKPRSRHGINLYNYEATVKLSETDLQNSIGNPRVIRFMDWMKTNNEIDVYGNAVGKQKSSRWDYPTLDSDWDYADGAWSQFNGIPLEIIVETANNNHAHAWVNIPHKANTGLIEYIVEYISSKCFHRPFFEFSNELWNANFYQYHYAKNASYGGDEVLRVLNFHAEKTILLHDIVDGCGEVVAGGWTYNEWYSNQLMERLTFDGNLHCDALAIAPYFGQMYQPSSDDNMYTMDKKLRQEIYRELAPQVKAHRTIADLYGVNLISYEAGQHLTASSVFEMNLYGNWNRSELARNTLYTFSDAMHDNGLELIMWYASASQYKNQFWGMHEIVNNRVVNLPKSSVK